MWWRIRYAEKVFQHNVHGKRFASVGTILETLTSGVAVDTEYAKRAEQKCERRVDIECVRLKITRIK